MTDTTKMNNEQNAGPLGSSASTGYKPWRHYADGCPWKQFRNNMLCCNATIDEYNEYDEYNRIVEVVKIVICILGLIGNILSIIATVNVPREKWSTYNKLIINLAVSDILIVCSVFVYIILTFTAVYHPFTEVFHQMFLNIALTSTLFNLVLMAIDHYFAIIYALYYDRVFSDLRVNCVIICLWFAIFLIKVV